MKNIKVEKTIQWPNTITYWALKIQEVIYYLAIGTITTKSGNRAINFSISGDVKLSGETDDGVKWSIEPGRKVWFGGDMKKNPSLELGIEIAKWIKVDGKQYTPAAPAKENKDDTNEQEAPTGSIEADF